jgi:hypothetical protein
MTDPATLLALAERCEQAAGPDKELDFTIDDFMLKYGAETDCIRNPRYVLPYTASLDAAVTLVPEGWRYDLTNGDLISEEKPAARLTPDFAGPCFNGYARTVPLALCIAALRARAAAYE